MKPQVRAVGLAMLFAASSSAAIAKSPLADAAEKSDHTTIRALLKQHTDVNALRLDNLVYALYGLTSEEIKIMEKALK